MPNASISRFPARVLDAIDRFTKERGQTRSGLLVEAATQQMGRSGDKSIPDRDKRSTKRHITRDR